MDAIKARVVALCVECLQLEPHLAADVAEEYLRFMWLKGSNDCAVSGRSTLAPSKQVDDVWHTRLLDR